MKNTFYYLAIITCGITLYKGTQKESNQKINHIHLIKIETELENAGAEKCCNTAEEEARRVWEESRESFKEEIDEKIERIYVSPLHEGGILNEITDIKKFLSGESDLSDLWIDTDFMSDIYPSNSEDEELED
ncbi:hypothetical protein H6G33_09930 [Calothrix sp. FACHB-1219]|uniref:hypothetical protein n=1 Tax=unclassified Calothrix TaxID=2619626 RepID=UPI001685498D|nr:MULTISPECIES: hypothetical protein [unclassified Calothrix]MBD2201665.1 hypothetical protein [Calothrix sp. FACHB-168]MBD2217351.1 hypothetical protein [Calothrix sp. FACHB-1219]